MLFFVHIPKTSGTSFKTQLLDSNYAADEIHDFRGVREFLGRDRRKVKVTAGHFEYGLHRLAWLKSSDVRYITWLRDPVDRVISHYYFIKDSDPHCYKHPLRDLADSMELSEFCSRQSFRNLQSKFITGHSHSPARWALPSTRNQSELGERAVEILAKRFDCWGILEHYEQSMEHIRRKLELPNMQPLEAIQKKTLNRPDVEDLDESTLKRIREMNAGDTHLYLFAKRQFLRSRISDS